MEGEHGSEPRAPVEGERGSELLVPVEGEHGSDSGGGRRLGGSDKGPLVVEGRGPSACCGEERLLLRLGLERLTISSAHCRRRYASVSCEVSPNSSSGSAGGGGGGGEGDLVSWS